MMQGDLIQDVEDQLAFFLQKARQSHQGWAKESTFQPAGLHRVLSPRE